MKPHQTSPLRVDVHWDGVIVTVTVTGELDLTTAPGPDPAAPADRGPAPAATGTRVACRHVHRRLRRQGHRNVLQNPRQRLPCDLAQPPSVRTQAPHPHRGYLSRSSPPAARANHRAHILTSALTAWVAGRVVPSAGGRPGTRESPFNVLATDLKRGTEWTSPARPTLSRTRSKRKISAGRPTSLSVTG